MLKFRAVRYALIVAFGGLISNPVFGAGVSFSPVIQSSGQASGTHADLNHDGREDFVYENGNGGQGFSVQLSNVDGTYGAPIPYTVPNGNYANFFTIGDFNSDGNPDLLFVGVANGGNSNALYLYLNNGNGTFTEKASFPLLNGFGNLAVGDFNHDGIIDLALEEPIANTQDDNVVVWFGDGKSGFKVGPSTPVNPNLAGVGSNGLLVGDFDGDGRADLAISNYAANGVTGNENIVDVLFGDNTGYFPVQTLINAPVNSTFGATDVNSDGKLDIVASSFPVLNSSPFNHIEVYYGDTNRAFENHTIIPIAHCARSNQPPIAADMNGDGINDLIVGETDCANYGSGSNYIGILTRNGNATYNPDQIVYTTPQKNEYMVGPFVLRANPDTKPDIAFVPSSYGTPMARINVLLNTTTGNFHTCNAPNAFEGINVCSPGSTATSPVSFRIGAAGQGPMRKVEVWVDGKKQVEQLDGFSNYSFLDDSLTLMNGTHEVDIYAAGWDNSLQKKSFSLNVH